MREISRSVRSGVPAGREEQTAGEGDGKAGRGRGPAGARRAGPRRLGFVPTMGALHEGHLSLVRRAREVSDMVVLSIFVNPKQFGPAEDFERYPRDLERDAVLAAREGVEFLFTPSTGEIYPPTFSTSVEVERLSRVMCGASRPGHFRGVATVVLKLLNIISPDVAVFGAKDFQQWVIIRRMAADLNLDVELLLAPIVRETDGLAMSSRNASLPPGERQAARILDRSLHRARGLFARGERAVAVIEGAVRGSLEEEPLARIDYVAVVDPETLEPVASLSGPTLVAIAVRIGGTRLIDNVVLGNEKIAPRQSAPDPQLCRPEAAGRKDENVP